MKKAFVIGFLGLLISIPVFAETPSKKVVVEKSSFAKSFFMISGNANASSSAVHKGEGDAQYLIVPNGKLEVNFIGVTQDKDPGQSVEYSIGVEWGNVEIQVDSTLRGMTVSYERQVYFYDTHTKVILAVPSEHDKNLWKIKAERFYAQYLLAFWEKKHQIAQSDKDAFDKEKALREALKKGPVYVLPNN